MTETQYRFLKAITERVPEERIVEVRLFPAIRQGGVESGVAVVATDVVLDDAASPDASPDASPGALPEGSTDADTVVAAGEAISEPNAAAPVEDVDAGADDELGDDELPEGDFDDDDLDDADEMADDDSMARASSARAAGAGVPSASERPTPTATSVIAPDVVASSALQRYSVHSARYRLALKGPDRGKWEFDIVHQADAPLDTVERVVRGVAHRAGEQGEAETFTAAELRTALSQPWWNTEP